MKINDFHIRNFNRTASAAVADQNLNFCQAITLSYGRSLSVTAENCHSRTLARRPHYICKKLQSLDDQFYYLGEGLTPCTSTRFADYYYGVSPKIDGPLILDAISRLAFSTPAGLDRFLSEHGACFMFPSGQQQYLLDFARYAVLAFARVYGIRLALSADLLARLRALDPADILFEEKDACVWVHGCPTEEALAVLRAYRYAQRDGIWHTDAQGVGIDEIYRETSNISLLQGQVFYSGVLFRPTKFLLLDDLHENYNVQNVRIGVERTTFATVHALDNVWIDHPLLAQSRPVLIRFFQHDDACKRTLQANLSQAHTPREALDAVNEYLATGYNVNQIGVSGDIVTRDHYLLFGMRGSSNIDEGMYYPGVNGNAEFRDSDVSFYAYSILEDYPSIRITDERIDFLGEVSREAYGELLLECPRGSWDCYGIVLSGIIPPEPRSQTEYLQKKRRMHFNILFGQETQKTFEEILEMQQRSVESFEALHLKGIQIAAYQNTLDRWMASVGAFLKSIVDRKDLIEAIALLILLVISIRTHDTAGFTWDYVLTVAITLLMLLCNLKDGANAIRQHMHLSKFQKRLHIYTNGTYDAMCSRIDSALGKQYHPVAHACLKAYVENLICTKLSGADKDS